MAMASSSGPVRGVPLGLVVAGMIGLQVLVMVVAAFALRLPIFAGRN